MNALEKIFNSIRSASSKELKLFSTHELINQLNEYEDYNLYILKNIYTLITSELYLNRLCGAKLLQSLDFFEYTFDFSLSQNTSYSEYVYLQFKDIKLECKADVSKQKKEIKSVAAMDHLDEDFLEACDLEKTFFHIKLQTAEYKEKTVDNIFDFFEAINLILTSPDWFKRHGGFLAYAAIVAAKHREFDFDEDLKIPKREAPFTRKKTTPLENRIKISISGDLFNKIFEILKNDKFNDFQDDMISCPVREASSLLLKYIYPMINNKLILYEITHLLTSTDWQEQFSALLALSQLRDHFTQSLIDGVGLVDNFLNLLINKLDTEDEDVKFLSADLLGYIINKFTVPDKAILAIKDKSWLQIDEDLDIAHSKASFLVLLKIIYSKMNIPHPSSYSSLYPCFTSYISLIRDSSFELSQIFEAEEFLYLLAESILLEFKGEYKNVDILKQKIKKYPHDTLKSFGGHFLKIISNDILSPYKEDDFACYDDTFFTPDGIKSVGCVTLMNSRSCLFSLLLDIEDLEFKEGGGLLSETFVNFYKIYQSIIKNEKNFLKNESTADINDIDNQNKNLINAGNTEPLENIILSGIDRDFKSYQTLKRMPLKEFKAILSDKFTTPLYPQTANNLLELVRKYSTQNILKNIDFSFYFSLEKSEKFLEIFCNLIKKSHFIENITLQLVDLIIQSDEMLAKSIIESQFKSVVTKPKSNFRANRKDSSIHGADTSDYSKSHKELLLEQTIFNCQIFFRILGEDLLMMEAFDKIFNLEKRLTFFKYTIPNYIKCLSAIVEDTGVTLVDFNYTNDVKKIKTDDNETGINSPSHSNSRSTEHIDAMSNKDEPSPSNSDICSNINKKTEALARGIAKINQIFDEAFEKKNIPILKSFISNMKFNCTFVKKLLANFDLYLLSNLIEFSDPRFNILFVRPILKNLSNDKLNQKSKDEQTEIDSFSKNFGFASETTIDTTTLLSTVICSLHFSNANLQDQELSQLLEQEREEIKMIVDPSSIKEYQIKIPTSIELRDYQKEGVKWIAFLSNFYLNGILADDMGLGKTIQVLSYFLNEMYMKGLECVENIDTDVNEIIRQSGLKLLILCPSSLTAHWTDEIKNFFNLDSIIYDSKKIVESNIIVCSYDIYRRDTILENKNWFSIIFDEGHLLKNRSTILYSKVKKLNADKKFVLTGTPIHNSVDDLFSLFDLIMPNYLGTESTFNSQYNCKINDKNVEVMKNRLESLHKKTLPFIMRRLKSEVLKDLPPKIIKDLIVEMNPQQSILYHKIYNNQEIDGSLGYSILKNNSFLKIRDCLKAASHPHYFDKSIPSTKTVALQEIFSMCETSKILIFFQYRSTIDYVLNDLKLANYLRLDGSVPPNQRGLIVRKFNTDACPYLFLTTSVGGLGLNLTSADIIVFYEHDWNPFNDLQAMDRAHRLGQKNTVNVFRLICKNTTEETVMNYQNFKLYVANSLITQQNNEITKMDTKDLLERFQE